MIPTTICLYLILAFGFDLNGQMASQVGRDPTLTDRTLIWRAVLGLHTNPLIGTGYESFWLGPRLNVIWAAVGHVNEAHNGYLEVYLNLGLIGLCLLVGFLLTSYRQICRSLSESSILSSLSIALWTVVFFYNMTEAAFRGGLLLLTFLLLAVSVSETAKSDVRSIVVRETLDPVNRNGRFPLNPQTKTPMRGALKRAAPVNFTSRQNKN
jgi:O-antigen ligase